MYRPARRVAEIAPFHVVELLTRARQLEAAGRDIIHMEIGEPDFPTPAPIVAAAEAALRRDDTRYTQALGLPALREAVAGYYATQHGLDISPQRIAITQGASGALNLAFACLADPGSEWLLTDPGYPCNRHIILAYNGVPRALPVGPETRFQPTPAQLTAAWTPATAGLLVASPANPTGSVLTPAEITALADACRARNGHFLVDEIYHGLTYGEAPAPTALAAGEDIWVIQSFSKHFQMTGWRLGWMVVPEAYVRDIEKLAQNLVLCPPTLSQHAALAAFTPETRAIVGARRAELRQRRDRLAAGLNALGLRVVAEPEGAFYLYCDCSALAPDSFALCHALLEEAGVAVTPGIDFGQHAAGSHLRVAYTTGLARIDEALARLAAYFGR